MKKKISMFLCIVMVLSTILGNAPVFEVRAAETVYGTGATFDTTAHKTEKAFTSLVYTYEVTLQLDTDVTGRGGAVIGNYYNGTTDGISLEIYNNGKPRLYYRDGENNKAYTYWFGNTDVRSEKPVRLTIVRNANGFVSYINGVKKETVSVSTDSSTNGVNLSNMPEFLPINKHVIGGDLRSGNAQYFKGTIYDVSVWSDARTAEEVACSHIKSLDTEDENLIAAYDFTATENQSTDLSGNGYNLATTPTIDTSETPVFGAHTTSSIQSGLSFEDKTRYMTETTPNAEPYTMSSWVYLPSDFESRGGVVFGNYKDSKTPCVSFEINTATVSEETVYGVPRFYHINSAGEVINLHFTSVDIRADEWVHLAYTIDEANNAVSCYLNGVLKETKIAQYDIDMASVDSSYLLAGDLREATNTAATNAQYFKGRILEVDLYKEPLAETELRELYVNGVDSTNETMLAYYELQSAKQGKDISDLTGNGNNIDAEVRYFAEKETVKDYAYSFAVIPDTQIVAENDVKNGENNFAKIYDWILANKTTKNIQYVFGLGDITDNNNIAEWTLAKSQISKLDGQIPYSVIRGNHDLLGWFEAEDKTADYMTQYLGTDAYKGQFANGGFYSKENIWNSWRTFTVGEVDYLMLALDYGPSDDVLNWASEIISAHPKHQVIITTHAYLYRDGTTLDTGDACPPSTSGGYNNGDDIWKKLVSKHENIVLVMCGHDPSDNIVVSQDEGEHGNIVTSMLIDPQYVDRDDGSTGMVAMLYFTEDGKHIQVEYYSTAKEQYFKEANQFEFSMKIDGCERVVQDYTAEEAAAYIARDNDYPKLKDYIFAGWYTDEACDETCLYAENTPGEKVYALFVPDDVLSVKAQITSTLTDEDVSNDSKASIRFVTTVDSLLYSQVGFELSYVGADNRTYKATSVSDTVHKRLYTIDSNSNVWCKTPASTFCGLSKYFRACTIKNLSTDFYNTKFTVKPYWITADGDKVYGESVTKSIADGCVRDEIWVSSGENSGEAPYYGSYEHPFSSLNYALAYVSDEGTVHVKDTLEVANGATWTEHEKSVTITGNDKDSDKEFLDFSKLASENIDVCIGDDVIFNDIELTLSGETTTRILAQGHDLEIASNVTFTNEQAVKDGTAKVQILGGSASEPVESTNLKIYAGSYNRIYGGGSSGEVLGNTNVIVGAGVNSGCNESSHSSTYSLFGGGYKGAVNGNTNVTVLEGAKFNYVYGGGEHADSIIEGTTNVNFAGNAMSVYGGSMNGTNADTYVSMTGGEVEQIFGGCYANSMTGNTNIQVTGGTVVRRIYGGCYRDMDTSGSWETNEYFVTGHTNVRIGEKAVLSMDYSEKKEIVGELISATIKPDNALYAISRNGESYKGEWGTFIFNEDEYESTYKGKLGQHGDVYVDKFSAQTHHYLVTTNGNTADNANGKVSPAGNCIKIEPNSGYVATVTYKNTEGVTNTVYYTEDAVSYYPLPILKDKSDKVEIYVEFGRILQTDFSGYEAKIGSSYYLTEEEANIAAEKLEDATVVTREYGTGYVPVQGQQVKTTSTYADFPRTIEVTFKKTDVSTRSVLVGSCDGKTKDFFNLELEKDSGLVYLNLTLNGVTYRHSFTNVKSELTATGEEVRLTIVIEDNAIKCYINGELKQTRTASNSGDGGKTIQALLESAKNATLPSGFGIGDDLRDLYYFNGTLYDVALWSDVRTEDEVATSSIGNINADSYQDNLIAAYDFRNSYNPVYENAPFHTDLSGNGYALSGTLNIGTSATPVTGVYSTSSIADGVGTKFTATMVEKTVTANPYTISTWVYLPSTYTSRGGVIWGNYKDATTPCVSYEIYNNGMPRFYHINGDGKIINLSFSKVNICADEWTHIAFTTYGSQVSCYLNGVLIQTLTDEEIDLEVVSKTYILGGDFRTSPSNNAQYFKGRMLELTMYDNTLSASLIRKLYNAGKSAISKNPLASYEFLTAE